MKLEKNNKYNGKKLLNNIKIILLSSTLLMGCSSVKAEEIETTPEPTPVTTSTPTPIPTPEPTPELTDMEKLKVKNFEGKQCLGRILYLKYEIEGEIKIVFVTSSTPNNVVVNLTTGETVEIIPKPTIEPDEYSNIAPTPEPILRNIADIFSDKILFKTPDYNVEDRELRNYDLFIPQQESLKNAKVLELESLMFLNYEFENMGLKYGIQPEPFNEDLDTICQREYDNPSLERTLGDYANFYLTMIPEEYRAYAVDYVDEYNPIYNKIKSK